EVRTGTGKIRIHPRKIFGQCEIDEELAEIGRLYLEGGAKLDDGFRPLHAGVEREYQQQQENAERIAQVCRRSEELAVGEQDKGSHDACENEEKQLPAVVGLQRDEALYDIIAVVVRGRKNAGDADDAENEPDPHQGPVDAFRYRGVSLVHSISGSNLLVEMNRVSCGAATAGV